MKLSCLTIFLISVVVFASDAAAQARKTPSGTKPKTAAVKSPEIGHSAVVVDETLSVLRVKPSLFAESIQRMRRGRKIQIMGVTEADGVKFYRVTAPPANYGWVQADAVFGKFRPNDEERLASLVQAADGFEQIEIAAEFFDLYPNSRFRPAISLLFGDVLEQVAAKLSKDAASRLNRKEMAATAAPIHSYFLNFVSLDRYRKLNIVFLFNSATRQFHYDGTSWKDLVAKFPASLEAIEATKRLDSLRTKLSQTSAAK